MGSPYTYLGPAFLNRPIETHLSSQITLSIQKTSDTIFNVESENGGQKVSILDKIEIFPILLDTKGREPKASPVVALLATREHEAALPNSSERSREFYSESKRSDWGVLARLDSGLRRF
eukprot:Lithocolla_globosa_v1_NODE_5220_length_1281_cov_10.504894.p1 type:complete len:119 gc:universal NODE_5220_length_1281_cov_10.504894:764-408(-)